MFARIGIMRALNRHVERVLTEKDASGKTRASVFVLKQNATSYCSR
jgi:hypothetical protein